MFRSQVQILQPEGRSFVEFAKHTESELQRYSCQVQVAQLRRTSFTLHTLAVNEAGPATLYFSSDGEIHAGTSLTVSLGLREGDFAREIRAKALRDYSRENAKVCEVRVALDSSFKAAFLQAQEVVAVPLESTSEVQELVVVSGSPLGSVWFRWICGVFALVLAPLVRLALGMKHDGFAGHISLKVVELRLEDVVMACILPLLVWIEQLQLGVKGFLLLLVVGPVTLLLSGSAVALGLAFWDKRSDMLKNEIGWRGKGKPELGRGQVASWTILAISVATLYTVTHLFPELLATVGGSNDETAVVAEILCRG